MSLVPYRPGYQASRYWPATTARSYMAAGLRAWVVGDMVLHPFWVGPNRTVGITKLAMARGNAVSGNLKFRVGIYDSDNEGRPRNVLQDGGTCTHSGTTAYAWVDSTASPFTEVTLTGPAWYHFAVLCETAKSSTESEYAWIPKGNPYPWPAVKGDRGTTNDGAVYYNAYAPIFQSVTTGSFTNNPLDTYTWATISFSRMPGLWIWVNSST